MNQSPRFASPQTAPWIVALVLAVIATALWMRQPYPLLPAALAQTAPLAGARGVYAFTGPIDNSRFGLFMLDVDQGTIWCYELDSVAGTRKLRLIAARTWLYDRYLQDFNCAAPSFRAVQQLVAEQRAQAATQEPPAPGDGGNAPPRGAESREPGMD